MKFDWDAKKNAANKKKHGVSFEEAVTAFDDPNLLFEEDEEHSSQEDRTRAMGAADSAGIVLVVFTEREGEVWRIISARKASKKEKAIYYAKLEAGQ